MTKLDCSVVECKYNEDHGCVRDNIQVGGKQAESFVETRCDSFEERRGDTFMNSTGRPSESLDIRCEAKQCRYNEDANCHAQKIDVAGFNACKREDTACGTFSMKES